MAGPGRPGVTLGLDINAGEPTASLELALSCSHREETAKSERKVRRSRETCVGLGRAICLTSELQLRTALDGRVGRPARRTGRGDGDGDGHPGALSVACPGFPSMLCYRRYFTNLFFAT